MDELPEVVPRTIVHARNDVDAKVAFLIELERQGFSGRITREPADITAIKDGEVFYFEIKKTSAAKSYFGAATLTEWEAAVANPTRYFFVTAQIAGKAWVFHEYTPEEFMSFSTVPPFKVFFNIPVGEVRAERPAHRETRSVRLTPERIAEMAALFARWRGASDSLPTVGENPGETALGLDEGGVRDSGH